MGESKNYMLRSRRIIKKIFGIGYRRNRKNVPDITIYPDDVYLVSYPRSGNTWVRYLLANALYPDIDWKPENLNKAIPDIYQVTQDALRTYKSPRIIKSHDVYRPYYPKVIYLYRDGRDVCVSCWNYYLRMNWYEGGFQGFFQKFMEGDVAFGKWHKHVEEWLFKKRRRLSILPVSYEALNLNAFEEFTKILSFLKIETTNEIVTDAISKCSLKRQINDGKYTGGLKGGTGKWKGMFTEQNEELFWNLAGNAMAKLGYNRK